MRQPSRRHWTVLVAVAAASAAVLTGCGRGAKPAETSTSHSLTATSKIATPGGQNNFSPTPVAPLTPTAGPGQGGTNPRP